MTTSPTKYFITETTGTFINWFSVIGEASLSGQSLVVTGNSGSDSVWVGTNTTVDATALGGGVDHMYLMGNFADYTVTRNGTTNRYIVQGVANGRSEQLVFASGADADVVHFADGHLVVSQTQLRPGGVWKQTVSSADLNTGSLTPSFPASSVTQGGGITKVFITDTTGENIAGLYRGAKASVTGNSGVDTVWVSNGTEINATNLGGGADKIYLEGDFADYTITRVGTTNQYLVQGVANGRTEKVTFASGSDADTLHFANGHVVLSQTNLRVNNVFLNTVGSDKLVTSNPTPGLSDIQSITIESGVGGQNNFYKAGDVITLAVTLKKAVTVSTTAGSPTLDVNVGGKPVKAVYDSVNSTSTVLKFKYTVGTTDNDANGLSVNAGSNTASAISLNGATINLTDGGVAAKLTQNPSMVDNASYKVDNTAPTGGSGLVFKSVTSGEYDSDKTDAITNKATGDVVFSYTGTNLSADEKFQYNTDGGSSWTDVAAANVDSTAKTVTLSNLTLSNNPTVRIRAIDAVGNSTGTLASQAFTYDGAAPTGITAISFKSVTQGAGDTVNDATTNQTNGVVVFGYTGALATGERFQYSVDGTTWHDASSIDPTAKTITLSNLALSGSPTVQVRAIDAVGNIATTTGSQAIVFDGTAPTGVMAMSFTSVSSSPNDTNKTDAVTNKASGDMVFTYTGTGLASGERFQYTIDNGNTWVDVTSDKVDTTAKTLTLSGLSLSSNPMVKVRAIDDAGNPTTDLANQTVTYVGKAPALPIISALALSADSGNDFITNTATQDITATLSAAPANGETLWGSVDGGNNWVNITNNLTGTALSWVGVTLAGKSSVQFKVRDVAGNESTVFSRGYEIDTTATNTLSFVGLAVNDTVSTNQVVQGIGAEAGAQVQLLSDGNVIAQDTALADGSFSFTLPPQATGTYSLALKYTDVAGNTSMPTSGLSVTWGAAIAAVAPSRLTNLVISADTDSGASQTDGITNVAAVKLTGSGGVVGATVEVSKVSGGTYIALSTTATVQADGTWSLTLSGGDVLTADTTFVARQKASGSTVWSSYSSQYLVKFDNTASANTPTLLLDAASDSGAADGITNVRNLNLSGVAEAGATVEVRDGNTKVATVQADATTGAWSTTLTNVSETTHSYTARQIDVAGNASDYGTVLSVKMDTIVAVPTAPVLDAASDSGTKGDNSTTVLRPVLTGTGAEADATLDIFDGANKIGSTKVKYDGSWTFTPTADLSVGQHSLRVSQTDVAGNASGLSTALNLTIAAPISVSAPSAPTLTAASDAGTSSTDGITNATSLTFTGTGAVAGGKVELWQGTTKLGEAATASAGVWNITVANMSEGASQQVKARVIDASGNTSDYSATSTIAIDRAAPLSVLSLSPLAATDDTGRLSTDGITNKTAPIISGSGASANARINIYNGTTLLSTLIADNSGNFSGPISLSAGTTAAGAAYTLSAAEVDTAGNIGGKSYTLAVTVDAVVAAPAITTSAATLAALEGNPSISGTGEAGAFIELFDGSNTAVANGYVKTDGTWTLQYVQTTLGTYTLSVRQTDLAGNVSSISSAVSATIGAGTAAVVLPNQLMAPTLKAGEDTGASATDGIINKTLPVIVISGVDASITNGANLKVFDGASQITGTFTDKTGGTWEFVPTTALTGGAAGTAHSLTVQQSKNGTDWSVASTALAVTVDTVVVAPKPNTGNVRFITLARDSGTGWIMEVADIKVYLNGSTTPVSLSSLGAQALASSGTGASNVLDGNVSTTYASANANVFRWLRIDLGSGQNVTGIDVVGASSNSSGVGVYVSLADTVGANGVMSYSNQTQLAGASGIGMQSLGSTGTLASGGIKSFSLAGVAVTAQPILTGVGEAGATVELTDTVGGVATVLGTAKVGSDGAWSFQALSITSGAHSITVKQTDVAGNVSVVSSAYNFTVPIVLTPSTPSAPTLVVASDTGSSSADGITRLTSVTVGGTGSSGDTIDVYQDLGNGSYNLLGTTVVYGGTWSLAGVSLTANTSINIVARAKNSAGTSDYSAALTVVNDSTVPVAPTAVLAAASDTGVQGDNLTSKFAVGDVTLTGTAEVGATITIKSDTTDIGTATVGNDGTWSVTLTAALTANAANALKVTATDKAGNVSAVTSYTVTHDNVAPTGTLTLSSGNSYGLMPTLSGSGAEANVYVDIYSGSTLVGSTQASAFGTWTLQLTGLTSAGSVTLTAQQRDAADNVGANVATFNITLSADVPVQANQAPALPNVRLLAADDTGSSLTDGITSVTNPRLTGTGAQANATVQAWEGQTLVGSTVADASGNWTLTPSSALISGAHSLSLIQQGSGQSYSNGVSYALIVADVVTAPAITTVAGDNTVSLSEVTGGTATASGSCLSGATVSVIFTNAAGTTVTKTATVTGAQWVTPTLSSADITTLGGSGTVHVTAKQSLGGFTSSASAATSVVLDMTLAAPGITTVAGDNTVSLSEVTGGTATASGSCLSGATVSVIFTNAAGTTVTKTATVTGAQWVTPTLSSADITTLGGSGTVHVTAKQSLGGFTSSASAATSVVLDMTLAAPGITTVAGDNTVSLSEVTGGTATASGSCLSGATVSVIFTNAAGTTVTKTATVTGAQWVTPTLSSADITTLGGSGTVHVTAKQSLGGFTSSASAATSVELDSSFVPATDIIINPNIATDDVINASESPAISGTATNGATVSVTLTNTSTLAWVTLNSVTANATSGVWTTAALSAAEVITLGGDRQNLKVTAVQTTAAGLTSSTSRTITIDTVAPSTAPVLTLAAMDADGTTISDSATVGDGITMQTQPTLSGKAEASAWVSVYRGGSTLVGTVQADTSGNWSFKVPTALADGAYSFTAKQSDAAGNMSAASTALAVTVDTVVVAPKPNTGNVRFITLARDSGTGWIMEVADIKVYLNGSTTPVSLSSLGAQALASSGTGASNVLDGNVSTTYASANANVFRWLRIDLGSGQNVTGIDVVGASSNSSGVGVYVSLADTVGANGVMSYSNQTQLAGASGIGMQSLGSTGTLASGGIKSFSLAGVAVTAQPILTGVGEAGATVELTDTVGGVATVLGTAKVGSDGAWSFQALSITSGAHSITVKQTDVAGNVSVVSSAYNFTVDSSLLGLPALATSSDSGIAGDGVTNITTPVLQGVGATAGAKVDIYDGSVKLGQATADANGLWSFTPSASLIGGSHSIVAKELAGDGTTVVKTSGALSLTVDTTAAAPVINAVTGNVKTAPVVTGTAEAGATVTLTATSVDGATVKTFSATANASGVWSVDTGSGANALEANKVYNLRASQIDVAGNVSAQSAMQTVNYDTQISSPVINTITGTQATSFSLTGTGEAGATVRVFDGGVSLGTAVVNAQSGWSLVVSGLSDGAHTLKAEQVDLAGNLSTQATQSVTVSSTVLGAPILAVASDSGVLGDGITNVLNPGLSGVAAANASVEVWDTLNGVSSKVASATASSTGAWSLTLANNLAEGNHSLVVKEIAADGTVGRTSSATALVIDSTAPGAASTMALATASDTGVSTADGITMQTQPTLSGKAEASAWVSVYRGGSTLVGTVQADTSGNWSFKVPTALADGAYSFTAKQSDAAGNMSAASTALAVTVDTVAQAPYMPIRASDSLLPITLLTSTPQRLSLLGDVSALTNLEQAVFYMGGFNWVVIPYQENFAKVTSVNRSQIGVVTAVVSLQAAYPYSAYYATVDLEFTNHVGGGIDIRATGSNKNGVVSRVQTLALVDVPLRASPQPILTGAGEAGATVELTDTVDGTATVLGTAKVGSSGAWSFQALSITSGAHSITAKQTDVAGNVSVVSSAYNFTVDSSLLGLPALATSSDSGIAGDGVTNITTPVLQGAGATAGAKVDIYDGSVKLGQATADANGLWSFTPSASLIGGSHSIVAKELAGDGTTVVKTSGVLSLTVDTTAAAPVINAVTGNVKTAPVVTGTAEAGATVTLTATSVDGATVKTFSATANASGVWSVDTGSGANALEANKVYNLRASQIDVAGNVSAQSAMQTVNYDTQISSPVINTITGTQATSFSLTGTGEAGATVRVFDGGVSLGTAVVNAQSGWSLVVSGLSDGAHTLKAEQVDLAGNLSTQATQSVTVSSTVLGAPVLAVASDSGVLGDGITNVATPMLTGSNAVPNAMVEVWEGSTKLGTAKANDTGVWGMGVSNALSDGVHNVVVKEIAADGTVARTSGIGNITVDTVAAAAPGKPVLDAACDSGSSSTDGITAVTSQVLNGTAEALAKIELLDNGTVVATSQADGTGNWRISTTAAAGSHSYTARQTDAAGNVSLVSVPTAITVDTGTWAPVLSLTGANVGSNPFVSGVAEAMATVTVSYDGGSSVTVQADAQGNWRAQLPLSPASATNYALSVVQTDVAGNVSVAATGNLTVSPALASTPLAPPTLLQPNLVAGQDTGLADGVSSVNKPLLSGTGAQANVTVQLWANGIQVASTTANASGAYNFAASNYTLGLSEGLQRLTVRQVVGSVASQDSAAISWTVDSVANVSAPALQTASQFSRDAEGNVYANTASPTLGGSTEAGAQVKVFDNGTLWQTVTADAAGRWSVSASLPSGVVAHAITTQVTDVTGNVSATSSALRFIVLSSTPDAPTVSLAEGGDSGANSTDGITNVTSQWIKGSVGVTAGLASPTVLVYDNGVQVGSVQADATGSWTFNVQGLSVGGHVLTVRAKDVAGNLSEATTVASLTVDTSAPTVLSVPVLASGEDTGTSSTDGLTNKTRPMVSGTAEAGATVELYVNGSLAATTKANASTGAFSMQPTQALGQGSHSLTLVQVDVAGNRSALSAAKVITVDSVIGGVTNLALAVADVVYISAGEFVTKNLRPAISGYGEAGATVTLYSGSTALGTATVGANGKWTITPTVDLSASNTLTATQTDAAGNISATSAALKVAYDATATAPTVALQAATDTGVVGDGITSSSRPVLTGSGAASGDTIDLYNGATQVGTTKADASGNWAVGPSTALADGTYSFTVKNATQSGATVGALKVQVLTQAGSAPTGLTLAADADTGTTGDNTTNMANPFIEGAGADAGAIVHIMEGTKFLGMAQANGTGHWRVQTSALSEGAHSLTAVQVNAADVASVASAPISITVDSQVAGLAAPTLRAADDSGLVGDGVTNQTRITVNGSGAEANAWVTVRDNGVQLARVQALADGSWSASLVGLTAGAHSLTVVQTDVAGNVSAASAALALVVDNAAVAPTVALDAASRSSINRLDYTMQPRPTFTGTAEAGASVSVHDGSLLLGTAVANASGAWTLTSTVDMGLGRHGNVHAVQTDVAGNTSPASGILVVTVLPDTRGGMSFTSPVDWICSAGAADINGDGLVDLWYGNDLGSSEQGAVLLSNTGQAFVDSFKLPMGSYNGRNGGEAQIDFNGDGRVDHLIVANWTYAWGLPLAAYRVNRASVGGLLSVDSFVNVGTAADGTPAAGTSSKGYYHGGLSALGDVNGDGEVDFAVTAGNQTSSGQSSFMVSTAAGIWRQVKSPLPAPYNVGAVQWADVNSDGVLDALVSVITNIPFQANGYQSNSLYVLLGNGVGGYEFAGTYADFATSAMPGAVLADVNGDGKLDVVGSAGNVLLGSGGGAFRAQSLGLPSTPSGVKSPVVGDVNADGKLDLLYYDGSGNLVLSLADANGQYGNGNAATGIGWDNVNVSGAIGIRSGVLTDLNNDRALDWISIGGAGYTSGTGLFLNPMAVAENTYLKVMVANDHGGLNAYGALVSLYDHATGVFVATRAVSQSGDGVNSVSATYGADFYGLDSAKTYDVVVVYPGSDKQVTVLTGKAGLGVANINASALNQIVDSSLTAVSPGGKDVVWVAKENRLTSATGGYWQGTGLADQMVGDLGADVFKPNGARIGECGDTLTGGGGKDRFVFDVKAVLNTGATITDFTATAGAESDTIDMGALLTAIGYTGARTAAGVATWVQVMEADGNTTLQVDAHTGTGGAASGFVDLVTLNGVTGKSLADLVGGGFVHLGGLNVAGVAADQTITETASGAGVQLASAVTIGAEGGQWAAGFNTGKLVVTLEGATAEDTLGFGNINGVTVNGSAVSINGTQVATIDATQNGVGVVGKLSMHFDFAAAGASYATEAQQAAAVQAVMQSLKLTSSSNAPSALDRAITFTLTDALGDTVDVYSGMRINPEANTATVGGVKYITGTESIETLVGTSADETFVGYNGVPTVTTPTYGQGDTLTGGGGKDTFKWLSLQLMNSDANEHITDFGLKGGTGAAQGAAEADVLDLSELLKGYTNASTVSDFIRSENVNGKVQIQVDFDGKANGSAFEKTWFMNLDNLSVNANNEVLANNATVAGTAPGLSGNVTIDTLVQQMMADQQFKVLP